MLGIIGLTQAIGLAIAWLATMIFIITSEIIGTKRFNVKFKELNNIIIDEFTSIISTFKDVFRGV